MLNGLRNLALAGSALLLGGTTIQAEVDFTRDIRPIFAANCVKCHGGVKSAGGVSFVYRDHVIGYESDSGRPVVKPGDPDGSELFYRITTTKEDDRMPPADEHGPLSAREIALIKEWIQSGATWQDPWAFVPPVKSTPPASKWDARARNDIDRFIFARLEREGLAPSPIEEPGRLLRRLSLGLTGLPPTVPEVDAFEKKFARDADAAVTEAVDELLSRPSFGERWATMWLDLVRYADSRGLGLDTPRTIWPFRDWVVNAFNDDLPFDQFTIQQLAGDLLPEPSMEALVATACQRNTQTNDEGGTDDEEFRMAAILDRVNTTWQAWGATTFGCVQCHDHPYDPIRHDEYYQFSDYFNNSADSDLGDDGPLLKVPKDASDWSKARDLDADIQALQGKLWAPANDLRLKTQWKAIRNTSASSNNGTQYQVDAKPDHDEFHTVGTVESKTAVTIQAPAASLPEAATALRLTVLPLDPAASVKNPEWGFIIDKLEAFAISVDGKKTPIKFVRAVGDVPWLPNEPGAEIKPNGEDFGADSRIHYARELVLIPESPITLPEGGQLELTVTCNHTGHLHPMVIKRGHLTYSADPAWAAQNLDTPANAPLARALAEARKERKRIASVAIPYMQTRPANIARPTYVFIRGNFLDKDAQVHAALPASLAPGIQAPTRLDMARWWVSPENPLTARVFVNRLWEQLFGVGIVPTLEDFGSSGEKPTHPQLLDYLAVRFESDLHWSVKGILREIVLSTTYRQSARVTPELVARDPDNRLLARGPRIRLTAEEVRDQALALSGLLARELGGQPVHPPIPDGVWKPFYSGDKWNTDKPGSPDRYRRSLYTYIKRSIPYPSFATFDAPSRESCSPRRLSSNTPLQALVTLNDQAFVECADALAGRMQNEFTGSTRDRLAQAYRLVTARPINGARLAELEQLQQQLAATGDAGAAWVVVAQVLLNMDEVLNL